MAKKLTAKNFISELAGYSRELRKTIEAECLGFDSSPEAQIERIKKVNDPVDGYAYFVQTYFPHYVRSPHRSQLHNYLFQRLPEVVASASGCTDAIAAPRGEAKSTLVTQLFTLWCVIRGIKKYCVLIMDGIDQAYPMLEAIKVELQYNPRLSIDFPAACGQGRVWNVGTILTNNNIKISVAGSGKRLRGLRHGAYRPDLVVLDDIENDENVRKPEQRDKLDAWLSRTVLQLGEAGGKFDVIYIGTILHYDSVLSRTLKNPLWSGKKFKAILRYPDDMTAWETWEEILRNEGKDLAYLFYVQNKTQMDAGAIVSWAARPLYELMLIRVRDGHDAFDSEYQNDPVSGDNAPFAGCVQFWVNRLDEWIFYGAADPSLGKHGTRRDPSALLVGGFNRATGVLDVVEAQIKKRLPDKIIEDIIALHIEYKCLVWAIEAVQFQEFLRTELVKRSAVRGVPVPARAVIPHTDKVLRIESLQPHFSNSLIRLHPSQTTLIEQLRHFPMADHDDGPDALQMLWALAVSSSSRGAIKTVRKRRERGGW